MHIGHNIIHFDHLPSTNVFALDLLSKSKPPEGTVISTDYQFSGKGQLNNKWESEANKNITLSVILYPQFLPIDKQFALNQMVSLAVQKTIYDIIQDSVLIKWPNDIYIGRNKVAGILIQNQIKGKKIQSAVIGIGINVNQENFLSSASNPISLVHLIQEHINLQESKNKLYFHLQVYYKLLMDACFDELTDQYLENLYLRDTISEFCKDDGTPFQGMIKGVDELGRLQILIGQELKTFMFKEIKFLNSKSKGYLK
ncbi:MAG: biotin--[acetyl-CoA-carboxylase] ligase [Bacteroidia bacterium]|nr:biotin--[acetyl-CoA-carboxylase] ligase [Bacteroidia bacterium]